MTMRCIVASAAALLRFLRRVTGCLAAKARDCSSRAISTSSFSDSLPTDGSGCLLVDPGARFRLASGRRQQPRCDGRGRWSNRSASAGPHAAEYDRGRLAALDRAHSAASPADRRGGRGRASTNSGHSLAPYQLASARQRGTAHFGDRRPRRWPVPDDVRRPHTASPGCNTL
jgi:hypothetical protein